MLIPKKISALKAIILIKLIIFPKVEQQFLTNDFKQFPTRKMNEKVQKRSFTATIAIQISSSGNH